MLGCQATRGIFLQIALSWTADAVRCTDSLVRPSERKISSGERRGGMSRLSLYLFTTPLLSLLVFVSHPLQ